MDQDCKTKKWIDGSRFKKARPKKQSLYRCPGWGHRRSLQVNKVDRWIKIKESKTQLLYRCPGWGRRRSLQVTIDHNTTTTGQSFHACVTIIYVKKYTV